MENDAEKMQVAHQEGADVPDCIRRGRAILELPQAEEARAGSEAAARKERMKQRTPRVDGAELLKRTLDFEVFA